MKNLVDIEQARVKPKVILIGGAAGHPSTIMAQRVAELAGTAVIALKDTTQYMIEAIEDATKAQEDLTLVLRELPDIEFCPPTSKHNHKRMFAGHGNKKRKKR